MAVFKQLFLVTLLLSGSLLAVARYVPDARPTLIAAGVPAELIESISADDAAAAEGEAAGRPPGGGSQMANVTTKQVTEGIVDNRLTALGNGEALKSVSVVPLVDGVVTEVPVQSGNLIQQGDVLAKLNSDTEEIARDLAAASLESAENTLTRYQTLIERNGASQVDLINLQAARDEAAFALKDAEQNLLLRTIHAPITGTVGIVPIEVGDYATTETEIALIDDRSQILVDFWVPERFAGTVTVGQPVSAEALALNDEMFEGEVRAIGSRIDTESRTFQVRAVLDNDEDRLRPGMSFTVSMKFAGDTYPAVDPLAVQWDSEGSFVWAVQDDKAVRVPARIIQRNTDTVLVDADIQTGAPVITEGLLGLRDGADVMVGQPNATGSANAAQDRTAQGAAIAAEAEG